jgi:hypothetical protein
VTIAGHDESDASGSRWNTSRPVCTASGSSLTCRDSLRTVTDRAPMPER